MTKPDRERSHADPDHARLLLAFGAPAWAWFRDRLRRALTNGNPLPGVCSLQNPSADEWDAATALLGRPASCPGKTLRVSVVDLETRLMRAGLCASLREALETIDGPIRSRPEEAERENAIWDKLVTELHSKAAGWHALITDRRPDLAALAAALARVPDDSGMFDRSALRSFCQRDVDLLESLLADLSSIFKTLADAGPTDIPRTHLAASALGDSHALDGGTLLFRAIARIAQQPNAALRDVWKTYRVLPDEVSSSVLVLNLRFSGDRLAEAVNGFADAGEPCRLLLRHGNQLEPHPHLNDTIHVCENPSVLEAAAIKLGVNSAPMICTEGQPSLACQNLLIACCAQSLQMCYHGDFDWGGIRIANFIHRIVPAITPWRYRASDYEVLANGSPLEGVPVDACWDSRLRPAMTARNEAYHEEQLLPDLIADLSRHIVECRGNVPSH